MPRHVRRLIRRILRALMFVAARLETQHFSRFPIMLRMILARNGCGNGTHFSSNRPKCKSLPAGDRQGSAERMANGGQTEPVARHGPAGQLKCPAPPQARPYYGHHRSRGSRARFGQEGRIPSRFALGDVLGGGHDFARYVSHMFAGTGKLGPEEFRLNAHRLLQIRRVNQLPRMFKRGFQVLLGE
jgi:hypothetical protein